MLAFRKNVTSYDTGLSSQSPTAVFIRHYYTELQPRPRLALVDHFGVVNITDSVTIVTASVVPMSSHCQGRPGYLSDTMTVTAYNGFVEFRNLTGFCYPGGNMTIQFTAQLSGMGDSMYNLNAYLIAGERNTPPMILMLSDNFDRYLVALPSDLRDDDGDDDALPR